jgi:hypothetical protein
VRQFGAVRANSQGIADQNSLLKHNDPYLTIWRKPDDVDELVVRNNRKRVLNLDCGRAGRLGRRGDFSHAPDFDLSVGSGCCKDRQRGMEVDAHHRVILVLLLGVPHRLNQLGLHLGLFGARCC